jgi:hypothetical protein
MRKYIAALALTLALASCGGGGGHPHDDRDIDLHNTSVGGAADNIVTQALPSANYTVHSNSEAIKIEPSAQAQDEEDAAGSTARSKPSASLNELPALENKPAGAN